MPNCTSSPSCCCAISSIISGLMASYIINMATPRAMSGVKSLAEVLSVLAGAQDARGIEFVVEGCEALLEVVNTRIE